MTGDLRREDEAAMDDAMDEVMEAAAYGSQGKQSTGLQWSEDVKQELIVLASSK